MKYQFIGGPLDGLRKKLHGIRNNQVCTVTAKKRKDRKSFPPAEYQARGTRMVFRRIAP